MTFDRPGLRCPHGAVASWLVRSSPDRAVLVRALAGDITLSSSARHFTLTVPLSPQVYEWVLANLILGVTMRWTSIPVELLLEAACNRSGDKLRLGGPLGIVECNCWRPYAKYLMYENPKLA